MQYPRDTFPDPAGRQVVTADGDDVGRVERVIAPPADEDDPLLVVDASESDLPLPEGPLVVPRRAVHLVTEGAVVLGTSSTWLVHDQQARQPHA